MNKHYWEKSSSHINAECGLCDKVYDGKTVFRLKWQEAPEGFGEGDEELITCLCNDCFTKTR